MPIQWQRWQSTRRPDQPGHAPLPAYLLAVKEEAGDLFKVYGCSLRRTNGGQLESRTLVCKPTSECPPPHKLDQQLIMARKRPPGALIRRNLFYQKSIKPTSKYKIRVMGQPVNHVVHFAISSPWRTITQPPWPCPGYVFSGYNYSIKKCFLVV